jgi:hypothetical protein
VTDTTTIVHDLPRETTAKRVRPRAWRKYLRNVGYRCGRAFIEWFAHSLLLFGIFCCIDGLRRGLLLLGIPTEKKLFERIPLEWLFDGAHLALLIGIALVGVTAAVRSYLDVQD